MRKNFFKASLLVITLVIWFSFLGSVWGAESSGVTDVAVADDSEWRLIVDGAVSQPLNLTISELEAMPSTTVNADLYCYSSLVSAGNWVGVRLGLLLETAGLQDGVGYLQFFASDGYSTLLDIPTAMQENVIIAYKLNKQPVREFLRLVIPGANGDKWIALITRITVGTGSYSAPDPRAFRPPEFPPIPTSPMHTPQPDNQSTTPAVVSPSQEPDNSTIQQQQELTIPNQPLNYGYAVLAVMVVVIAVATGYLYLKHKKNKSMEHPMDYGDRIDSTISAKSKIPYAHQ